MDRISILGSGWLGQPLALQLQARGYSLRVSTTRQVRVDALTSAGLDAMIIDIARLDGAIAAFLDADLLICNITSKDLHGFASLVRALEESPVRNLLFVSSTSVYPNDAGRVREGDGKEAGDSPLLQIEQLLQASNRFRTTVVRFGGLFGPGRHPGRFFRRGGVTLDPDAPVNLIHLDDCIGIIQAIIAQQAWGHVFNCCAPSHPSKREFYTRATQLADAPCPNFAATASVNYKVVDSLQVQQVLGYRFRHPDLLTTNLD